MLAVTLSNTSFRRSLLLLPVLLAAQCRAVDWLGSANSAFSVAANWGNGGPIPGAQNAQVTDLKIINESLSPMCYTAAEGETVIGSPGAISGQFIVGHDDRSGRLEISGGSLRIYSYWSPILAQNGYNTTGTIHVSGGVLRISNTSRTKPDQRVFLVGNTAPKPTDLRSNGAIFITGGTLIIDCEGIPETRIGDRALITGGLNIGRSNGSGLIYLTGGELRVTSTEGTSFVSDNGKASGILSFGLGNGVFKQTASQRITFGNDPDSDAYITFQPGSRGAISLAGATPATFNELIAQGRIRVDGCIADPDRFRFTQEESQGVLRLASAHTGAGGR